METCVWLMVSLIMRGEWKCTGIQNGGLSVMMDGMYWMLKWSAGSSTTYLLQFMSMVYRRHACKSIKSKGNRVTYQYLYYFVFIKTA